MFAKTALATIFATAAVAAPASLGFEMPETMPKPVAFDKEKAATGEQWTVQYLKRYCNPEDTECVWKYLVNTYKEGTDPYHCEYTVTGSPASKTDITDDAPAECEVFKVTQGYDPQGFTVIVPVHVPTGRHIYAGFADWEYANGHTAQDKTFPVEV